MPGKRQISRIGLTAFAAIVWAMTVQACPYCPRTSATLSETLAQSDVAYLVSFQFAVNQANFAGQASTFEIVKSLKTSPVQVDFKTGKKITIPIGVTADVGDQFLIMGQLVDKEMEWNLPVLVDEIGTEVSYLLKAPSPERERTERLTYFWRFLDSKIPLISNDAFGEFSRADFKDIKPLIQIIERSKLRKWLEDPDQQLDVRRGFYGMLLGMCGNEEDAAFLEKKLFAPIPAGKNRLGIDGMMAGFVMLRGQPGLQAMIAKKVDAVPANLLSDDPRLSELADIRLMLNFLWDYRREQFQEDELRAGMRRFLQREEYAESAIVDLARWKDWASLEPLIAAYGHSPWDTPLAKEKVVAFALCCLKDVATKPDPQRSVYGMRAQQFLDTLDPDFVESVKQGIGGHSAVADPGETKSTSDAARE